MLLDPNGGGMALPDLRDLIETRIPENREQLDKSPENLMDVANYCERNYLNSANKAAAFEETKQYAVQSLASVAYQINTLARDLMDMLNLQTDKISQLSGHVENVNMVVNIHKEKMARREIGVLTTNKSIPKQPKIITPAVQDPPVRYKRTPIDFSILDGVGHGVRVEAPSRPAAVSRAPSAVSNANHYGHYGQYERTANIGNNTLSRSSLRSGPLSISSNAGDHYRPVVMPMLDPGRYSAATTLQQQNSEYGSHNMSTPTSNDYGSQHGSSDYGGGMVGPLGDRYSTLRAVQHMRAPLPMDMVDHGRISPALPPPPPAQSMGHYGYGSIPNRHSELPPPPPHMMNTSLEDDPLPPPPMAAVSNYFDTQPEWVPREGSYIEKAVALYDYDADKADELSLRENCVVYVVRKNDDGWYEGVLDGVTGLFPGNYVRPI